MTLNITIKPSEIASNGGTERAFIHAMKSMNSPFALITVALLCFLPVAHAAGPATNVTKRPQPERWLLIVDTSAAMERRAKAVEGVVGELLVSGMNGQMAPGSEIGIWSYNKELYAGVAPMQTWDPARSNVIAGRSVSFLSKQVYRDKSKIQNVMDELAHVVSDSRQLTIVWFSDGSHNLTNTPFDEAMIAAYAEHKAALAKTRMPLVTVLRVYHGKYSGQNVSVAPWPVEFPAFPVEPEMTNAVAKPAIAIAKPVEPVKSIFITRESSKADAEKHAPVETKGDSIKLRPPPEGVTGEAVPPAPAKPAQTVEPLPIAAVEPVPVAVPIEPAPMTKPAEPAPEPKRVELAAVPPAPAVAVPSAPVVPVPQVAVASGTVTARKWPLILGISFMWLAIAAALLLARRARRANASSLITRSFDRDQK